MGRWKRGLKKQDEREDKDECMEPCDGIADSRHLNEIEIWNGKEAMCEARWMWLCEGVENQSD